MKKFNVTGPAFSGEWSITYATNGKLKSIDLTNAELSSEQMEYLIRKVPVEYTDDDRLVQAFETPNLNFTPVDVVVEFREFWDAYRHKVNRLRCEKLWDKLSQGERADAYLGLNKYKQYLLRNPWRSMADPETYLRNRYWENEYRN